MTDTASDEKIAALLARYGLEAYGLWWRVLEVIAGSMDKNSSKCSVKYPLQKWANCLGILPQNVRRQVRSLIEVGLIIEVSTSMDLDVTAPALLVSADPRSASAVQGAVHGAAHSQRTRSGFAELELCAPNLLKYRDEYSRKSGHTPENVGSKKQIQNTDTDTDTDKTPIPPLEDLPVPEQDAPTGADIHADSDHKIKRSKPKARTLDEVRHSLGIRLPWFEALCTVHPAGKVGVLAGAEAFGRKVSADEDGHVLAQEMYRGAKTYAEQCRQDSTIRVKWLQGWINGERWRDAQLPTNGNGHGAYQKQTISEQVKELALNNLERSGRML